MKSAGTMTDVAAAVRDAQQGDSAAFGALVRQYQSGVYGLASHLLGRGEDARDVAQEAFIHAYLHLGELRDPDRFAGWLRRLTVNRCRMWKRSHREHVPLDPDTPAAPTHDETDTRLAVDRALLCLSEAARLTVRLFYFQECSTSEIATFLDVPVSTVRSRLRNARARLRKEWVSMDENALAPEPMPEEFARQWRQARIAAIGELPGEAIADGGGDRPGRCHCIIECFQNFRRGPIGRQKRIGQFGPDRSDGRVGQKRQPGRLLKCRDGPSRITAELE